MAQHLWTRLRARSAADSTTLYVTECWIGGWLADAWIAWRGDQHRARRQRGDGNAGA